LLLLALLLLLLLLLAEAATLLEDLPRPLLRLDSQKEGAIVIRQ
jgi:hypothetical protein